MKELIAELQSKAGLSEEQAMKALQVLTEHIKSKLPPMMQGMVDNFIGGQQPQADDFVDGN